MSYLEMFIVVMAIILLSTIAIIHHHTMASAADMVTNASHTVQAMQVALELLDSIDAKLMAANKTGLILEDVHAIYDDYQTSVYLPHYQATFNITATVDSCDIFGVTHPADSEEPMDNLRVTVQVQEAAADGGTSGQRHPVSQSRVYTVYALGDM